MRGNENTAVGVFLGKSLHRVPRPLAEIRHALALIGVGQAHGVFPNGIPLGEPFGQVRKGNALPKAAVDLQEALLGKKRQGAVAQGDGARFIGAKQGGSHGEIKLLIF